MEIDGSTSRYAGDAEAFRTAARAIRISRGVTQGELAALAGVSRRWLSRFETSEDPDGVELHKALAIARALELDVVLVRKDQP